MCGLRRSGFSSPTCTDSTPHTNFYTSCNSTPWIIVAFLEHCLLFWGVMHPLRWNHASFVVASSPSHIRWRYRFPKFRFVSHAVTYCLWTTHNHQFCFIFWRWRIHTPVCCGIRVRDCLGDVRNPAPISSYFVFCRLPRFFCVFAYSTKWNSLLENFSCYHGLFFLFGIA